MLRLEPSELDCSGPWLLWKREPEQGLRDSLTSMGQLEPVLMVRREGAWALVSGYCRVRCLQEMGCQVLALDIGEVEAVGHDGEVALGLRYLAANQAFSLGEQGVVELLLPAVRFFMERLPPKDAKARAASALGLPLRSRALRRLEQWCGLFPPESPWNGHLLENRLPIACVDVLFRLEPGELDALEPFYARVSWSSNGARQFMTLLFETARRDGVTLEELASACAHLLLEELSPKDLQARLLEQARRMRHPRRCELEQRFSKLGRELTAGTPWKVAAEVNFEADALHLTARLSTPAQALQAALELERMAESPLWGRLVAIGDTPEEGVDHDA